MAIDKKSDHVGNHGGAYTDLEGNRRQFTYVDHDVKTSVSTTLLSEEQKIALFEEVKRERTSLILRIMVLPASLCPEPFYDFTLRGETRDRIEWNETMLKDEGLPVQKLRDLLTLTSNKAESIGNTL